MVGLVHELLLVVKRSPSFNCHSIRHCFFFVLLNDPPKMLRRCVNDRLKYLKPHTDYLDHLCEVLDYMDKFEDHYLYHDQNHYLIVHPDQIDHDRQ
jgi:hypothetical protein